MTTEVRRSVLGELPSDWSVCTLSDVVEKQASPVAVTPTQSYRQIGIRSHGKGIFHKEAVTGSELGDKRVFWIKPNCLVFNIVFAWEGAVAVTSENEAGMIASHRFPMLAPRAGRIVDVEFLRRFFQTALGIRLLGEASPGGAGRNRTLNQKFLGQVPVPLPPILEQTKIAAILSSVDDAIEATQSVIDQLQVVKKAMMAELLTRGLPGRHTRFKMTEIGEVPEEWKTSRIADLLEESAYGTSSKCDVEKVGLPVLRIPNVVSERVTFDDLKYTTLSSKEVDSYSLQEGDLLVIRTNGNPLYVGRSAVVPKLDAPVLYASYLIRLRVNPSLITSHFLHESMRVETVRKTMQGAIRTSAGNYNLNTQGIGNTVVPLPPLAEQTEIASTAHAFQARIDTERSYLEAVRGTKTALMSALLTGEVRVAVVESAT